MSLLSWSKRTCPQGLGGSFDRVCCFRRAKPLQPRLKLRWDPLSMGPGRAASSCACSGSNPAMSSQEAEQGQVQRQDMPFGELGLGCWGGAAPGRAQGPRRRGARPASPLLSTGPGPLHPSAGTSDRGASSGPRRGCYGNLPQQAKNSALSFGEEVRG
uniref:Uncharacterized protein n=1 Tax=Pipistrellus kuhlii TaxID=59472 RepID=A0A7J7R9N9_PIPKU|nr:hypothetical protein mPipKuh1_010706 [Pipistrellus kuhlii]